MQQDKPIIPQKKQTNIQQTSQKQTIRFQIISNSLQQCYTPTLRDLLNLKNLYCRLMPKMPPQYLIKLLFDHHHQSIIIKHNKQVLAGVTFRKFKQKLFYQIAFFGVNYQNQLKGYGKLLMNKLKQISQSRRILYFFTYADDKAVGFFRKNDFSDNITVNKKQYKHYVKEYIGGTFMQCYINPQVDYFNLEARLKYLHDSTIKKIYELAHNGNVYQVKDVMKIFKEIQQKEKDKQNKNSNINSNSNSNKNKYSNLSNNNNNNINNNNTQYLIQLLPGISQSCYSTCKSLTRPLIPIQYLFLCQSFIQHVYKYSSLLLQDQLQQRLTIQYSQSQTTLISSCMSKYDKYINLLQYLQKKVINGQIRSKQEFIDQFEDGVMDIIGNENKYTKQKQKQFRKKVKYVINDYYQNRLVVSYNVNNINNNISINNINSVHNNSNVQNNKSKKNKIQQIDTDVYI